MRIISGNLKGRKINFIKNLRTRPLRDSVKENIFNILKHSNSKIKIENSNILDLFSGIGSFGIECLSRGANKVTFIEKDQIALNILKKNLIHLSIINKTKIINEKIESAIELLLSEKFQIFFLDPPFVDFKFIENLKVIKQKKIFDLNHIIIIHREKKTRDNFENLLEITDTKIYGRSKIIFGHFSLKGV